MSVFLNVSRCYNCGTLSHIVFITSHSNILENLTFQCICQRCGDHQGSFSDTKAGAVLVWNEYMNLKASLATRDIDKIECIPDEDFRRKRAVGDSYGSCFDMVRKSSLRNFINELIRLKHDVDNSIDSAEALYSEVF